MICTALRELFSKDRLGEASFDAVKLISRFAKARPNRISEEVIQTFLSLRLKEELVNESEKDDQNKKRGKFGRKRKRDDGIHTTRTMKKVNKKEVKRESVLVRYRE